MLLQKISEGHPSLQFKLRMNLINLTYFSSPLEETNLVLNLISKKKSHVKNLVINIHAISLVEYTFCCNQVKHISPGGLDGNNSIRSKVSGFCCLF